MRRLSTQEIEIEKKIYDEHFTNLDSAQEYFRNGGYWDSSGQMLAAQGAILRLIAFMISKIFVHLQIDGDILQKIGDEVKAEDSEMILLPDACKELSSEGFSIKFDPSTIRNYLFRHPECFDGVYKYQSGPGKKEITKYKVNKDKLVDALCKYPYQHSLQRNIIKDFAEWRKQNCD